MDGRVHVCSACTSAAKLAQTAGALLARIEDHRHPIAGSCLTPAKRELAVAGGEWLGAAGTVHDTKVALVDLSYGKRPRWPAPTNRSGKVP
jgi:hypothetical protein